MFRRHYHGSILRSDMDPMSKDPPLPKIKFENSNHSQELLRLTDWIFSLLSKYTLTFTSFQFFNKLTSPPMCGFIAQLVEQRTGNAEVTGSNPVEALIFFFFQASSFQLLKLENLLL